MSEATPFTACTDRVRVAVRLTPRAGRNRIDGTEPDARGGVKLKVSVTAAPEDGKANAALMKLLAREWRVPKSSLAIARGAAAREKTLHVLGDGPRLARRLEDWLAARSPRMTRGR